MHMQVCMCVSYNAYSKRHKNSLLRWYNVTCVNVVRANHLLMDNGLVCFSLGKIISPALSTP